jgi:hypothetical protein
MMQRAARPARRLWPDLEDDVDWGLGDLPEPAEADRDVWGYDWSGGSNVVEVVISALRRKLGDRAGSLQTVRGAGYRFTAPP